jgi:pSer/pThr/pTyr-binding forkhead associated (FHA) protein
MANSAHQADGWQNWRLGLRTKLTGIDDMAAKLILSMDGVLMQECVLEKERMTLGRKPHNDIVIDNLAVSGEHAAIVTILNDSFLEDLDSTNGVMVNGTPIKKHFLQNNDVIEIGKYRLKYLNEQVNQSSASEDFEKTMVLRAPSSASAVAGVAPAAEARLAAQVQPPISSGKTEMQAKPPQAVAAASQPGIVHQATVQILNGQNAGREMDLVKSLTTLGKPGVQVAVLTRRPHGYFITHVEGSNFPTVNGKVMDEQPHPLSNHDIIELVGVKMEFYYKD